MKEKSVCAYYEETFYGAPLTCDEPTKGDSVYCWDHLDCDDGPMDDDWLQQEWVAEMVSGGYERGHYKNGVNQW